MDVERKPFFKGPRVTEKERRRRKRETRDRRERGHKATARERDRKVTRRGCRFPKCGCHRYRPNTARALEVSHLTHKGMGGNPKEDRSLPHLLITLCGERHKESKFSIDKGTLECRPLTDDGTEGPVSWWVRVDDLPAVLVEPLAKRDLTPPVEWLEIACEERPGVIKPTNEIQSEILDWLAWMGV
jgi:hypothetical protein